MPESHIPEAAKHAVCEVCGCRCIPMADGFDWPLPDGDVTDIIVCHRCDAARGREAYEAALAKRS
jgi:hypothetical protein